MLGHGNCLQTARLELQLRGCFFRKLATFQDTGVGKGCNPGYFNPVGYLCRPRTLSLSFVGVRYVEGSQILRKKPQLSEPFWNRHVLYLALRIVTVTPGHCMGSKQLNNPWSLAPVTSLKTVLLRHGKSLGHPIFYPYSTVSEKGHMRFTVKLLAGGTASGCQSQSKSWKSSKSNRLA